MLAQSPEPEAHNKVLDNNPDRIGIWKCWFFRRGKNRSTRIKTSRTKEENQQQTQLTCDGGFGNRIWDPLVGRERSHHCAIPAPTLTGFKRLIKSAFFLKRMLNLIFSFFSIAFSPYWIRAWLHVQLLQCKALFYAIMHKVYCNVIIEGNSWEFLSLFLIIIFYKFFWKILA